MYFDDFTPGLTFESASRRVTERDIESFAALTGDASDLHMNAEVAAASIFGERIAHGALVFSLSTGLAVGLGIFADGLIAFYGLDRLRFTRSVAIDDEIRVVKRVADVAPRGDLQGIVTFDTSVLNQRNETVLVYTDKVLMRRRA